MSRLTNGGGEEKEKRKKRKEKTVYLVLLRLQKSWNDPMRTNSCHQVIVVVMIKSQ